ncbi:MAG TPA: type I-U CRISPR-associated RAMP protein Csb1/Cas7u [Longimicrobiales bacterium]|nr:type I-U CRISPR-associated RAMP protein Csb1/Cas7u [Longimicrobiales bacterium]
MAVLPALSLDDLQSAVAGEAAAVRALTRLQPAGGKGDKVFPPTYATDRGATTKYAFEMRRVDGQDTPTVLLDSVASQANRMEEALLAAWEDHRIHVPVISVDFIGEEGISDLGRITTLQAPHRIADALLRDSVDAEGTRFRDTPIGAAFTDASAKNATAIFRYCPTALVFGVWDSTGPRGGLGHKIQRALVSEVVGVGAVAGVKTASRLDPAGIQSNVEVYHRRDDPDDWTADVAEALVQKGKPVPFSRKGERGKGERATAAAINHSNIPPSIDALAGGVTLDYALQTTVLSLPALRRLRFPFDAEGAPMAGERRAAAERAARCVLAALALVAITELREQGYDLRSRSFLVPEEGGPLPLELVPSDGGEPTRFSLTAGSAADLLAAAVAEATKLGLPWDREPLVLKPAPKLAGLIRESRRRTAADGSEEPETSP